MPPTKKKHTYSIIPLVRIYIYIPIHPIYAHSTHTHIIHNTHLSPMTGMVSMFATREWKAVWSRRGARSANRKFKPSNIGGGGMVCGGGYVMAIEGWG